MNAVEELSIDLSQRRVLVVHPAMAPYRIDLFNALAQRCRLRLLFLDKAPAYDPNLRREGLTDGLDCDWSILAGESRSAASALPWRLRREARSFQPDVVVTHEFGWASMLSTLTLLCGRGVGRVLWTTRSVEQIRALSSIRRISLRMLSCQADAMLAYSLAARVSLAAAAGVPDSRIFVCANNQDGERLRRLAETTRGEVLDECRRSRLGGQSLIVTVGRLVATKDIATTIRAFATACDELRSTTLIIIGDGPLRSALQQLAGQLGISDSVLFLGHLSSAAVQGWLSLASLTVLASLEEPFGAVVAEGLAHGAPCICSATAGASSLVDSPLRGVVIQPGDPGAMANAFRAFAGSLRSVAELAGMVREDLRGLTVADDLKGFLAAVDYATRIASRKRLPLHE